MNHRKTLAAYGSWKSPITTDRVVGSAVSLGQIALDGPDIYWSEMRPGEGGRYVVLHWRAGSMEEMLPAPFSARTRVHEYGGGAFLVQDGVLYFSNDRDQLLYRLAPGLTPQPITSGSGKRYADGVFDHWHREIVCIREDHVADGEAANAIVSIDPDGRREARVLVMGEAFYASLRLSPDGQHMAWLSWNHPDMPWDGTQLWLAERGPQGRPVNSRCVAGGREESVFQPMFSPDGTLYFVSDRSNWWNLYRMRDGRIEALAPMEAEFGLPQWIFGMSTYAFESAQRLVCTYHRAGNWRLAVLDTGTRRMEEMETPFSDISGVLAGEGKAIFVASSPVMPAAIVRLDLVTRQYQILRRSTEDVSESGYLSVPQEMSYPSTRGATAHALYYPPVNRDFEASMDEKPPLLVLSHGGPTSATSRALNLRTQFWTSRGFAVLDVNYRGSTGYGRAYRRQLDGQWGIADVEDCLAGARYLVERGLVDAKRLAIRGSSAGGYTTLCALTFHRMFRAGAVYYGVSDLEALARDTHKFERYYLERLIGPYPQRKELYRERSPLHQANRLSCPIIFFQGLEDKVVPPNQTEEMVNALRARNVPVAYVPFDGEQHGFRRAENIRRALEAEFYFYSRVFGFTPADPITPIPIDNL
ncbi:MAG: S9 family peptidase [Gammaproteobacteria bacterium]|nr:S9 family peptidase [Gammaproteobacteria bacterium]MDH3405314.1 S9 family peptidase [Gammaproteobacteria bacterium]MDH3561774.1 S9 family peptidase [Gammaproteobacteria bacterium]MDH5485888.1 S9 family peptidase [Gammaproteobacteria bacterium]